METSQFQLFFMAEVPFSSMLKPFNKNV